MGLKSEMKFAAALVSFYVFFTSCNSNSGSVFEQLSSAHTNIKFENKPEEHKAFGILYYLYYYNGGGVAVGDINNDGLPDIYFTASNHGGNKLYLNKGEYKFEDITNKAGVAGSADWCTGVTMADVNGDGYLDFYVCAVQGEHGLKGRNELFINNGNGTFTESAEKYGLALSAYSTQAVFFDYDHDGDLDCFVLNQSHNPNQNIVDTSHRKDFDFNAGDRLYRNDIRTTGKFTDVSKQAGIYQSNLGYGLGISVADMNNDGYDDIYIGNDFHENDYYYINNGDGTFTESGAKHFGHYSRFSMGNDIADYNNDGQPDITTVDMLPPDEKTTKTYGSDESYEIYNFKITSHGFQDQVSRNCLQENNGNGISFSDQALMAGVSATDWSWCPLFADFDNDGYKDLFISSGIVKRPVDLDYVRFVSDLAARINRNSSDAYDKSTMDKMPDGASHPFLFKNNGNGIFTDESADWGTGKMKGYFNGAAYADLNNDGNLDLVINCINAPATVLKNKSTNTNSLSISFKGNGMNTFGVGSKAYVFTHTDSSGIIKKNMQYEELMLTRGFQSSSDTKLHFGLGKTQNIDSILIVWPTQTYQLLKNIPANKPLIVYQKNAADTFHYNTFFPPKKNILEDVTAQVNCKWKHKEDKFNDFNVDYLIPHKESTRGPKIAVGDINNDGLDDFYACGAAGQPGTLMMQHADGTFSSVDTAIFNKDFLYEDVDAIFFDANGDGFKDLLVISGGNEPQVNSPILLEDRLYLNNEKGGFNRTTKFLVQQLYNKSCVAVADVDRDGDSDIFIGGLASTMANDFGLPQSSYLFLNDGKGNFSGTTYQTIKLTNIGTVTSAKFTDLNNDGWPDLVVTGEWMSIKIFMNNHGKFTETDIPNSTGLWQTVYTTDINGDGYPDILAGNWGHNSKLWAGKNGPLKLYIKDFDNNGVIDHVLCYTIDGKQYPFLAKDELEKDMPVLKKYYLTYSEVAGKTVQYMFYDLFKDYTELTAETLGSACFINDGKGNFKKMDLPNDLQLAPVFAFAPLDKNSYIAGGNFYGTIPYEGKYDALCPTIFSFNKNQFNISSILPNVKGEVRDMKWLNTAHGKMLVIARNNDSLSFYKLNK
ncbi:MAG: VCBS repeat-containing protein [Parafilimonas sp.]